MLDINKNTELLNRVMLILQVDVQFLITTLQKFDKYPRFYHSSDHIIDLWTKILADKYEASVEKLLLLIALYHDYVYDPKSKTNEVDSAEVWLEEAHKFGLANQGGFSKEALDIRDAILDTKSHDYFSSGVSKIFCEYDLSGFRGNYKDIIKNETNIRKEYGWVDWTDYKKGKIEFLNKYMQSPLAKEHEDLLVGMELIQQHTLQDTPNIGIYAGSFNPFHIGHKNILEKAEKIFDKVVIAIGRNPEKQVVYGDLDWMVRTETEEPPEFLKYRQVEYYQTSIVDYFKTKTYTPTLIRGLRNTIDLQAEIVQTRWLQELDPKIKIVNIVCDREFDHISSSYIRYAKGFPDIEKLAESYTVK